MYSTATGTAVHVRYILQLYGAIRRRGVFTYQEERDGTCTTSSSTIKYPIGPVARYYSNSSEQSTTRVARSEYCTGTGAVVPY